MLKLCLQHTQGVILLFWPQEKTPAKQTHTSHVQVTAQKKKRTRLILGKTTASESSAFVDKTPRKCREGERMGAKNKPSPGGRLGLEKV